MIKLEEIRKNFFDMIFYFNNFLRVEDVSSEEKIDGVTIKVVSNEGKCKCVVKEGEVKDILIVTVTREKEDKAWLLPFKNGECFGIKIPKELKAGEDQKLFILTPSLTGCSIHILQEDNAWFILHDARDVHVEEKKTTRNKDFPNREMISYEWSSSGYRFVRNGADIELPDSEKEILESVGSSVMFYYDLEVKDWVFLSHQFYNNQSIGGKITLLKDLFNI